MHALPTEIRLHIYRLVWEPQMVALGSEHHSHKDPVTLQINHEARQETLRHYHRICVDYLYHRPRKRHGYISPNLDVLSFYVAARALPTATSLTVLDAPKFRIEPAITQPLLRITIEPFSGPNTDFGMVLNTFPLLTSTRTCSLASRSYLGNPDPAKISTTTARYRICCSPAKKSTLVGWEEAVFRPHETSKNSWCWKYSPAESRPLTSMPPNVDEVINTKDASTWPEPVEGSELRIPCAVSYWDQVQPQRILKKDDVLVFDAGPLPLKTFGPLPKTENGEEWVVLKVVDTDDVWDKELMSLAFGHFFAFSSASLVDHGVRSENGLSGPCDFSRSECPAVRMVLHWLDGIEWRWRRLPTDIQERAMIVGEAVQGVCGPGYMYDNTTTQGDEENGKYGTPVDFAGWNLCHHPLVSGPGIWEKHCGRSIVKPGEYILSVSPKHQEVLARNFCGNSHGLALWISGVPTVYE
ncbi:hypothetical protein QBC40DRAFT_316659 [Triangularia verruculosa]|uniref:2EXR domain-containing protein n=1 Tax=Triangularia verruculosa TaxID=2587418 RepID=A0AAN6X7I1_9PEZI|nr:hypothetical protein QBC40DRAFT_316659 [Triangularia verruculosa]